MPSTSAKQHRFMEAIAHNKAFAKKAGVPQSVGKDFSNADKGKTFSKGGEMRPKKQAMKPRVDPMVLAAMMRGGAGGPPPGAAPAPMPMAQGPSGPPPGGMGMKKGGMAKESKAMEAKEMNFMKKKGASKSMMRHEEEEVKGMKKGGMAKETMGPRGMGMDVEKGSNKLTKFGESAIQKKGHTKGRNLGDSGPTVKTQTARFAAGGSVHNRADGIAKKGFTKGRYI